MKKMGKRQFKIFVLILIVLFSPLHLMTLRSRPTSMSNSGSIGQSSLRKESFLMI